MIYVLGFYRDAVRELRYDHPRDMVIVSCMADVQRLRGRVFHEDDRVEIVGPDLHPDIVRAFFQAITEMKVKGGVPV